MTFEKTRSNLRCFLEGVVMFLWVKRKTILITIAILLLLTTWLLCFLTINKQANQISALEATFNGRVMQVDMAFVEQNQRAYALYEHMLKHCEMLALHEQILEELYQADSFLEVR